METERIIAESLYRRRPAYLAFPADLADQQVLSAARPAYPMPQSNPESLAAAVEAIVQALGEAGTEVTAADEMLQELINIKR